MDMHTLATARDRLLETASVLFYARGDRRDRGRYFGRGGGGVQADAVRAFWVQEGLVATVLKRRHTASVASLQEWVSSSALDVRERLLAVFDWLGEFYLTEGMRGCAFLNAAAERPDPHGPGRRAARRHKRWTRDYPADLARQIGLECPQRLGSQLLLLVDGASSRMVVDGDPRVAGVAAAQACQVAALLIDSASVGAGPR